MATSGCLQLKHINEIMRRFPSSFPDLRQLQRTAQVGPGAACVDEWPDAKTGVDIRGKGFSSVGCRGAGKTARPDRGEQRSRSQQFKKRSPVIPTVFRLYLGQRIFLFCFLKTKLLGSKSLGSTAEVARHRRCRHVSADQLKQ